MVFRSRGYIIYTVGKTASSKGVIIPMCSIMKDRLVGRQGRDSNGNILDEVLIMNLGWLDDVCM